MVAATNALRFFTHLTTFLSWVEDSLVESVKSTRIIDKIVLNRI
jgi:hypothetical protein